MTTNDLIAEARKLDAAATPGPWIVEHEHRVDGVVQIGGGHPNTYWVGAVIEADGYTICGNTDYDSGGVASKPEDAAFIARARTLLPQLADALEAERVVREAVEANFAKWRKRAEAAEARLAKYEGTPPLG